MIKQLVEKTSKIGSILPLIWFIGVFLFYIRARTHLGYWPKTYVPDPKSLPFEFHHGVLMLAVFPLMSTVFILPWVWLIQLKVFKGTARNHFALYVLGCILIGGVIASPGIDFVSWFLD
jgi:hypothetical protein